MTQAQHCFEQISGCRISLLRGGAGQPLLFLHGACVVGQWLPFLDALSQSFAVYVPTHPGFGKSETPEWLDTIGDLAYFYLDFIRHFGLKQVHLVGDCLGGWIAAELAVRDQTSLASLTLLAPAGLRVHGQPTGDLFMWSPKQLAHNLFYNQALAEAMLLVERSAEDCEAELRNKLATAKLGWQPRLHNPHLHKWLHRITVPTLVLWGSDDQLIPAGYGAAFRDRITGARLELLPNCGHLPHIEKMAECVTAVRSFCQGASI